jgi:inner membrane protein
VTARILAELGPWLWMVSGFALLAVEVLVPRGIALALGLGAILTGTIVIALQFSAWPLAAAWQQAAAFAVLTAGMGAASRRLSRKA